MRSSVVREMWKLIVVHGETGKRFDARDVHGDLDRPEEFREDLVAIARTNSYLASGGVGDWISDFEGWLYSEQEYAKNPDPGGWGTAERVLRYRR